MTQHIGFRCPEDIIAAIKARTEASGKARTDVLIDMLRASMPSMLVSDRGKLPQEPAIYFVWNEEQLLYIAKTDNLRDRFSNHPKLPDFMLAGVETRVSWLPATVENLSAFERSLIEELEPELNQTAVLGVGQKIIAFRFPEELWTKLSEQCQEGESVNEAARRIMINVLGVGGQIPGQPVPAINIQELIAEALAEYQEAVDSQVKVIVETLINEKLAQFSPISPVPAINIQELIADAIAQHLDSVDRRLQASNTEVDVIVEALVEEKLAQHWSDVDRRLQASNIEIKTMVETLIEEKLNQVPIKIPPNIPTQTQFQEMHTRINDFRGSLLREIQNRDKSINLFAEQIAELTARLDTMSPGVSRDELEKARDKILNNWRVAKGIEKKERIKQGIDKVIDEVYPQE